MSAEGTIVIVGSVSSVVAFARHRPVYLWVLFVIPPLTAIAHAATPGIVVFKGQGAGVIAPIVATALAVVLWLPYRRLPRWPNIVLLFLATVAITWLYQVVRTQLDQSLFNLAVIVVPVALLLIATKPVARSDADIAMFVLTYGLLAVSAASLLFGRLGWMPDGFEVSDGGGESRLAVLEWLGIPGRWGGPFGSVNYASPVGGLLIVFGATRHGWHRWVLGLGGVAVLALGQGRTAVLAVVAGLIVVLAWSPFVARTRRPALVRWGIAAAAVVSAAGSVAILDPTLNGRTPLWSSYLGLFPHNPVFGVGDSGILAYVSERAQQPGFFPHTHLHSVLLDALVRYGVVMGVLSVAIFGLALAAGVHGLRRGDASMLALLTFVVAAGLTETIHSWFYWSAYLATLTWVVLAAETDAQVQDDGRLKAHSLAWHDA